MRRHLLRFSWCVSVLAASSACSKFGRLSDSEKVVRLSIGTSGGGQHSRTIPPQTGGIMVWAEKDDGAQAAFYLPSETATHEITLGLGKWTFLATGWDGSSMTGTPRCGGTSVDVHIGTTDVTVPIGVIDQNLPDGSSFGGCGNAAFGTSAVRQLRVSKCSVLAASYDGDEDCGSFPGDIGSIRVQLNAYDTAGNIDDAGSALSACVLISGSSTDTGFMIPEGNGSGSPIDVSIDAYSDPSCGTYVDTFRFSSGFASASISQGQLFRNNGSSAGLNKNVVFLEHGPESAPSISGSSAVRNSLYGGFPLTVTGSNLDPVSTITVGGVDCPVTTHSPTSITCTAPGAYNGQAVDVVVTNHDGQFYTAASSFTFLEDGFGNGIDSDNISSSITISSSISDTSAPASAALTSPAFGRPLQGFANITNIAGNVVTLGNTSSSPGFAVHDDVLWHVSARSSGTPDCDSSSMLTAGKFGFARITAVSGSLITLDQVISASPNNANISASVRTSGSTFCLIQLVRVPNFENLTIDSSGGAITISPPAFSLSNGFGGILALKVADTLTMTGANPVNLDASGKGYAGGGVGGIQGTGVRGSGSVSTSGNGAGGGGGNATPSGGGGGGGVAGSGAGSYSAVGGTSATPLDPASFGAAFGGGGGGGNGAGTAGGNGGGIVLVYARNLAHPPALNLLANGAPGGTDGTTAGGGGSGGTVYAQNMRGFFAASITGDVTGGSGGSAPGNGQGAGAGGGFTSYQYCNGFNPSFTPTYAPGTGFASGGVGTGASHPVTSATLYCP